MIYSKNKDNNIYITLSEASKISGVSRDYLNVLIHRGKLRAVKIGKNWLTTKAWISECKTPNHFEQNQGSEYLSLFNAAKIANVSSGYLNVAVRRGKLRAVKLGRNWFTTNEWLVDYQKSVGRGISAIADLPATTSVAAGFQSPTSEDFKVEFQVSKEISRFQDLNISEKYELRNLKSNLILERERALETKLIFPEIKVSSRELKVEEKENILKAAKKNFRAVDSRELEIASRNFGILKSLRRQRGLKLILASSLTIILFAATIGFTDFNISKFRDFKISAEKLRASIFSDVLKNFSFDKLRINPNDLPAFSKWLADSAGKSLTFLKSKSPSELVIESLEYGRSKIISPEEALTPINTLAEAEALDLPSEFLANGESEIISGNGSVVSISGGSFTLLENRLSSVEARLDEQLAITNSELSLQKKTILGTLETLVGISKLVPSHPISSFVVQGQPATLTTYSVSPSVHTGFDRLNASYLSLSNNATINGSLTVKSGGTFDTLSVSGNTTLTGNATIGGTLGVTGDTTLSTLSLTGTLSAANSHFNLSSASSTNLTVSGNAWIGGLAVTGTATSTFAGPITIEGSLTANGKTLTISSTSTVSSQFTTTGVPIGAHTFSSWAADVSNSNVTSASMVINPASAGADTNLLGLAVNGNVKALIDAEGDLFINSITTAGGVTLATTTASTFTVENNTTLGDATGDTITVNARFASDLLPTTNNIYRIGTSSLRWLSLDANYIVASSTLAVSTTTFPFLYGVNIATSTNISGLLRVGTSSTLTLNSGNIINDSGQFNIVNQANSNLTFYTNNSERMRIDNSGNVGIGTTTPGQLLSVNGNAFIANNLTIASSTSMLNASSTNLTATNFWSTNATTSALSVTGGSQFSGLLSTGSILAGNATTTGLSVNGGTLLNSLSFGAATGTSLTVTGGSSFAGASFSGNVGIGTAAPVTTLDFGSTIGGNINGVEAMYGNSAGDRLALASYPSNNTGNSSSLQFFTSDGTAAERMRILAGGNLGIGTTSPGQLLSVNGNGYFAGNLNVASSTTLLNASTTNLTVSASTFLANATTTGLSVNGGTLLNSLSFGAATGTSLTVTGGSSFAAATFSGNVGIGTTSQPTSYTNAVNIVNSFNATEDGSGGVGLGIYSSFSQSTTGRGGIIGLGGIKSGAAGSAVNLATISGFAESATNNNTSGYLVFATQANGVLPSEKMRITSAGLVGIGTTSPGQLLSVNGNGYFAGNLNVASSTTLLNASTTNLTVSAATFLGAATTTSLSVTGGSSFAGASFSGNVGIGDTTTPYTALTVSASQVGKTTIGSSKILTIDNSNGNLSQRVEIGLGSTANNVYQSPVILGHVITNSSQGTLGDFYIATRDVVGVQTPIERFYITAAGNVGIASTSPSAVLSINVPTANGTTTALNITTATSSLIYVRSDGKIAIGTTTPFAQLSISPASTTIGGTSLGILTNNFNSSNYGLKIDSATSSLFAVRSDGNVGINTTTPTSTLQVVGTMNVIPTAGGNSGLYVNSTGVGIGDSNPQVNFQIVGTTTFRGVDGYVGIGAIASANNPNAPLEIGMANDSKGVGDAVGLNITNNGNTSTYSQIGLGYKLQGEFPPVALGMIVTSPAGNSKGDFFIATRDVTTNTAPTERLYITSAGLVGIGETAPGSRLSVSGSGSFGAGYDTTAAPGNGLIVEGYLGVGSSSPMAVLSVNVSNATGTTAALNITSATSSLLYVQSDGSVGVGTTTPGLGINKFKFVVQGNAAFAGCVGFNAAANSGTCVDVAESYPAAEPVEAGEIVQIKRFSSINSQFSIEKATSTSQTIIGIVSTNPAILINGYDTVFGGISRSPDSTTAPVALAGRVPVKVSLENGPIEVGDKISASSVAGVGKKASSTEATVGIALEAFDGLSPSTSSGQSENTQIGKILIFVNLGQSQLAAAKGTGDLGDMVTAKSDLNMNGFSLLNVKSITGLNNLWKIDENGNIIAQSVETQKLTVGGGASSGVTIYDRQTTAPKCIYIEGGAVKTSDGVCGTTTNAGTGAVIETASDSVGSPTPQSAEVGLPLATTTPTIDTMATSTPIVATTTEPVIVSTTTSDTATTTP